MIGRNRLNSLSWARWVSISGLVLILSIGLAACGDSSPTATETRPSEQISTATDTVIPTVTTTNAQTTLSTTTVPDTQATITFASTTQTTVAVTIVAPTTTANQATNPTTSIDATSTTTNNGPIIGATIIPATIPTIPATTTPAPPTKTKIPSPATPTPTVAPASSVHTGKLRGHIVAGPTCPVQRVDSPCPPRPVVGRAIYVKDQQSGNLLQTLTSDANGYFGADLKPGTYTVEVAKVGIESDKSGPHKITLVAGQTLVLEIELDTGMR